MSLSTSIPAGGDVRRNRPIGRNVTPGDRAPATATPPAQPQAAVPRPRLMWLVLALSAALVSMFVLRNFLQAGAIGHYLAGSGDPSGQAAGMTAESAGWIVDTSFVAATAWIVIALYAFSGSSIGRVIFTALLAASTFLGIWSTVDPRSAALGRGESILASAHPVFTSVTALAVVIVSIALIVLLYRPAANEYFRAHSATAGSPLPR